MLTNQRQGGVSEQFMNGLAVSEYQELRELSTEQVQQALHESLYVLT